MGKNLGNGLKTAGACLAVATWQLVAAAGASAQQQPAPPPPAAAPPAAPGAAAPAAAPAAPAAPTSNAMTTPSMAGPLVANPNPISYDGGPLGPIYFNGAFSALGLWQSSPVPGNHDVTGDISNGLVSLQTTSGPVQFFAQGGVYSFPTVGSPYFHVSKWVGDTFGPVPVAYAKMLPTDNFSIQFGKLPTLIGAEYGFTFQNMNIERGLLWAQEPIVSRGIQANLTTGPVAWSVSLNDGFYSDSYNWVTGAATWTVDKLNTLEVVGGGNFGRSGLATLATPIAQDNGAIVNLIYTYSNAPWTITPYFQYTNVYGGAVPGLPSSASTYGGAVLASYAFTDKISLAGRFEIIGSSGGVTSPNLLYGPGSSAMSFTLTPTWQDGIFFARAEGSVVSAWSTTPGLAFGSAGNTKTQGRIVLETGIVF